MGSTSDLPVMEKAAAELDSMGIPFEMNALSAHRTPDEVAAFAREAAPRGVKVIIAAAGMAAALPGVIAAHTTLPVIGVPIKGMLDGLDALLSIVQMPPAIPVATVGVNAAKNAAILAEEILALTDEGIRARVAEQKAKLKDKIVAANEELAKVKYANKTNWPAREQEIYYNAYPQHLPGTHFLYAPFPEALPPRGKADIRCRKTRDGEHRFLTTENENSFSLRRPPRGANKNYV